ncbi:MAG: signal peptidase I [Lachnospiraceae bacterium]|nr:signal peptidase I [Lachnospiraceae bacterium]
MARRKKGLSFYQKKKTISRSLIAEIASWLFIIAIAVFLAFVIVFTVGRYTTVIGDSMNPTLANGQKVLMNRFLYMLSSPDRGDVIVFLPHGNENYHYYTKRVVGLPGESVQIIDGKLYIDGALLEEGDVFDLMEEAGIASAPISLGENEYFVLGDNRNNSEDSRSADIGIVMKNWIIGKAWFKIGTEDSPAGFIPAMD